MSHNVSDRRYVIIPHSLINNIDFSEVLETGPSTVRRSLSGLLVVLKYVGDMPPSVAAIVEDEQEYNNEEILEIMATPVWSLPDENEE